MTFRFTRILALGACLLFAILSWAPRAQENRATTANPPPPVTVVGPVSIDREKSAEPNWAKPNCDVPQNHDEADLCQQQRMALAAEKAVFQNTIQIIIGLVTLFGLAATVFYAKRAASAAADAATHADTAAKAAGEANQMIRDNSALELRAYLSVEPDGINQLIGTAEGMGHVKVLNVGKLPARGVNVFVHMRFLDERKLTLDDLPVKPDPKNLTRVIQPGTEMRQGSDRRIALQSLADKKDEYVFVWGIVYYDDGYGTRRFTRFCHRYAAASRNRSVDLNDNSVRETVSVIDPDKGRYDEVGNDAD